MDFITQLQQSMKVSDIEAAEYGESLVKLFDLLAELDSKRHPELYKAESS